MLPMGTIMTVCMALGVLFASRLPWLGLNRASPRPLLIGVGVLVALAGLWNVLWYALRHLGEFWGNTALVSGVLMLLVAALLVAPEKVPRALESARPFVVSALLGCALLYGVTIYRL